MSSFATRAAGDFFGCVCLLAQAPHSEWPDADSLRAQLIAELERFRAAARSAGVGDAEIEQACFALVAWADERLLQSGWEGSAEWQREPLQLVQFQTVRAGNELYERLEKLEPGADRALEIYFYCLVLGFEGELAGDPERRRALIQKLYERRYAARQIVPAPEGGELCPAAYTWEFADQQAEGRRVAPLLAWMALGVLVLYSLCWLALRYAASDSVPFLGGGA